MEGEFFEGKMHGLFKKYQNGILFVESEFVMDVNHGKFIVYKDTCTISG